jgi:DNA polymerase I
MPPNVVSRHTPGTLVSAYEAYEAVSRGIAVPFRKKDPEEARACGGLQTMDRGGMMFQPVAGVYWDVTEIDFTSLYPAIIVGKNLSPETIRFPERRGFLAAALAPLLELRKSTKELKKRDGRYSGIDTVLKWLLVVSFGYTGFRNARFGSIAVHERITANARQILVDAKELAEGAGFFVLHGIVDSLWITGGNDVAGLQRRIVEATGIPVEADRFGWIAFLPQNDGSGAYTRYFGRQENGTMKIRGIAARRHDTPPYVRSMQEKILSLLQAAGAPDDLRDVQGAVERVYSDALFGLSRVPLADLVIKKRVSRTDYRHACLEGSAVAAYQRAGTGIAPGMTLAYVVRDARRHVVDPPWEASGADLQFYRSLLDRAWEEVAFVFGQVT